VKSVLTFLLLVATLSAQTKMIALERKNTFAVFGGMGVHMVFAPDIVEYNNSVSTYDQRVNDFGAAVDFFSGVEFPIDDNWGVKIEHSYLFKSYSFVEKINGYTYEIFYANQSPSILLQRTISGKGYFVKLGAGGGYHFGIMTQKVSMSGTTTEYTSNGVGIKTEVVGQTAFGDNVYGYIGGSLGWEFMGDLKESGGKKLTLPNSTKPISLDYFHAGIRFGMNYYF
jgi:hypothetical protein